MTQVQETPTITGVPDGSVPYYFHLSSALWGKHGGKQAYITSLIESALRNENGVNDVSAERHRIVVLYSPLAVDFSALTEAVQGVMGTLVEDRSDWCAFPFIEAGKLPVIIGSDDPVAPTTPTRQLLPLPTTQSTCVYYFNHTDGILPLVDGEFDKDVFATLVKPLVDQFYARHGILRAYVARCQIRITYDTTKLGADELYDFVNDVMQRFFTETPTAFRGLKLEGGSLQLHSEVLPD